MIVSLDVSDLRNCVAYRHGVTFVDERHGGSVLVRAGGLRVLRRKSGLKSVIVIEFPPMDAAMRCCESADYAPLLRIRLESATSDVVLVAGCDAPRC